MYGESLNSLEVILAFFILILLPAIIGLSIEIFDSLENKGNRRR